MYMSCNNLLYNKLDNISFQFKEIAHPIVLFFRCSLGLCCTGFGSVLGLTACDTRSAISEDKKKTEWKQISNTVWCNGWHDHIIHCSNLTIHPNLHVVFTVVFLCYFLWWGGSGEGGYQSYLALDLTDKCKLEATVLNLKMSSLSCCKVYSTPCTVHQTKSPWYHNSLLRRQMIVTLMTWISWLDCGGGWGRGLIACNRLWLTWHGQNDVLWTLTLTNIKF